MYWYQYNHFVNLIACRNAPGQLDGCLRIKPRLLLGHCHLRLVWTDCMFYPHFKQVSGLWVLLCRVYKLINWMCWMCQVGHTKVFELLQKQGNTLSGHECEYKYSHNCPAQYTIPKPLVLALIWSMWMSSLCHWLVPFDLQKHSPVDGCWSELVGKCRLPFPDPIWWVCIEFEFRYHYRTTCLVKDRD